MLQCIVTSVLITWLWSRAPTGQFLRLLYFYWLREKHIAIFLEIFQTSWNSGNQNKQKQSKLTQHIASVILPWQHHDHCYTFQFPIATTPAIFLHFFRVGTFRKHMCEVSTSHCEVSTSHLYMREANCINKLYCHVLQRTICKRNQAMQTTSRITSRKNIEPQVHSWAA